MLSGTGSLRIARPGGDDRGSDQVLMGGTAMLGCRSQQSGGRGSSRPSSHNWRAGGQDSSRNGASPPAPIDPGESLSFLAVSSSADRFGRDSSGAMPEVCVPAMEDSMSSCIGDVEPRDRHSDAARRLDRRDGLSGTVQRLGCLRSAHKSAYGNDVPQCGQGNAWRRRAKRRPENHPVAPVMVSASSGLLGTSTCSRQGPLQPAETAGSKPAV
jgi:hypothetical protein